MDQLLQFVINHWVLVAAVLLILGIIIMTEMNNTVGGMTQVTAQEAVAMINREDALMLDIRSQESFLQGHVTNAINIPKDSLDAMQSKLADYKEKPIIVACNRGNSAIAVGSSLKKMGFSQVVILKDGMTGWQTAGMPVVK